MGKLMFKRFKSHQADQYTFFKIPKMLMTDKRISSISDSAKILYGLLLDRMSLSRENKWIDDNDELYIIYSVNEVIKNMGCSKQKVIKLFAELDSKTGIGLIDRIKRGQGNPDIIYVNDFVTCNEEDCVANAGDSEKTISRPSSVENTTKNHVKPLKYENHTSRSMKEATSSNHSDSHFQKYENHTSRSKKITRLEVCESNPNNTDINNTNKNNNNSIISINANRGSLPIDDGLNDSIDVNLAMSMIKENMEYDDLVEMHPEEEQYIDEIVDIIAEVWISSADTFRIGGEDKAADVVKSRYQKVDLETVEYILDSLHHNTTRVSNIKSYLMTTIYNATLTKHSYYRAEASYLSSYAGDS